MGRRTIIAVDPGGIQPGLTYRIHKAPMNYPDARVPALLNCDPANMPPWTDAQAVAAHGRRLRTSLAGHVGVRQALDDMLRGADPGDVWSLYFQIGADEAELLWWETLCGIPAEGAEGDELFLALERRWPIARIADPQVERDESVHELELPLRITAVLSALGLPARAEWEALRDAAVESRREGLPIALQVMVGEAALHTEIGDEAVALADGGAPWVELLPLAGRAALEDLLDQEPGPHLVHFFCHGSAAAGEPRIELATTLDWIEHGDAAGAAGEARSSLRLGADDLMALRFARKVWMVTLNCCEGGRADAEHDAHSLAHRLVSEGMPAALGLLEPADAADLHELTASFYPEALRQIRESIEEGQGDDHHELEWARALRAGRRALADRHGAPASQRQWAAPVLYVKPERFRFRKVEGAASSEDLMRARLVAGALRSLPPDADPQVRDDLLALVADLPTHLRPDRFGSMNGGDP